MSQESGHSMAQLVLSKCLTRLKIKVSAGLCSSLEVLGETSGPWGCRTKVPVSLPAVGQGLVSASRDCSSSQAWDPSSSKPANGGLNLSQTSNLSDFPSASSLWQSTHFSKTQFLRQKNRENTIYLRWLVWGFDGIIDMKLFWILWSNRCEERWDLGGIKREKKGQGSFSLHLRWSVWLWW